MPGQHINPKLVSYRMAYDAKRDAYLQSHDITPSSIPYTGCLSDAYRTGYRDGFTKGTLYLRIEELGASSPPPEFCEEHVAEAWTRGFRDGAAAACDLHLEWLIEC